MLASDQNKDGKLTKSEAAGIIQPHFSKLDADRDGYLDREELNAISDWLNHHHQPGVPAAKAKSDR